MAGLYLRDSNGQIINPEARRREEYYARLRAGKRKKKHRTNKDKYFGRKLVRLCPHCYSSDMDKKIERIIEWTHDNEGRRKTRTWWKCKNCGGVWLAKDMINVHRAPGEGLKGQVKMTAKEFKDKIEREALGLEIRINSANNALDK